MRKSTAACAVQHSFMLASGSLWVFCTGCLSCCQQLTQTHTSTHRCRVLQQSVSISFHLYTFLFALATCFHTSRCLPHFFPYSFLPLTTSLSFSLPFSLCQSSYIYFFSIIGSIYFAQLFLPPPFVLCLFMLHFDFLSLNCICCFYFRQLSRTVSRSRSRRGAAPTGFESLQH